MVRENVYFCWSCINLESESKLTNIHDSDQKKVDDNVEIVEGEEKAIENEEDNDDILMICHYEKIEKKKSEIIFIFFYFLISVFYYYQIGISCYIYKFQNKKIKLL